MYFSMCITIIVFTVQLNCALGYVAKATVEAVSIVPIGSNKTNLIGPIAKVSQLFHVRQSNVSKGSVLKLSSEKPVKSPLSSRFVQKRHGDYIYNRTNNPLISSESWKDLNTLLPEAEMKDFLSSLPLHTLRNLTSMTRKNAELGQQQLVRLILDRSERFKDSNLGMMETGGDKDRKVDIRKLSGHKTNHLEGNPLDMALDVDESQVRSDLNKIHPSEPLITTTTSLPVLEAPTEMQYSTPSTKTSQTYPVYNSGMPPLSDIVAENLQKGETTMAESSNKNAVREGKSPRKINGFNSGYFIPALIESESPESSNPVDVSQPSQFSWQFQPQDPENTFQPFIDNFLKPPTEFDNDENNPQRHESLSPIIAHPSSSSVWVVPGSPGKKIPNDGRKNIQTHPFSGFDTVVSDVKLQPEASRDHVNTNSMYNNQEPGPAYQDQEDHQPIEIGGEQQDQRNPDYHYLHSTIHQGPPNSQIQTQSSYNRPSPNHKNNNYKPNSNSNGNSNSNSNSNSNYESNNDNNNNNNQNSNNNNYQQNQQQSSHSIPPPEHSPSYSNNDGWGWGDHNNDDFWSSAKAYFSKGKKSTSEIVFEISIAVLSFLAFGGYLLMLVYQVFAVSTAVPLFPFLSSTVPANPTVTGVLLGRNLIDPNSNITLGRGFNDNYINELENIVKGAMDRVKVIMLDSKGKGKDSLKVKGDLER